MPTVTNSGHSTDPLVLFDAPLIKDVMKDGDMIKKTLQREIRACQKLIIWTDCDREGENIGVEVIRVCQEVRPNIEVLRAKFSEITPAAIHRAINQLTVPDYQMSSAVDARQELDLRIGAAFTRFQTLRLQRVFPRALSSQLISYGSCQFPTLGFVVERFREADRFIPEPFWRITVTAEREDKSVDFAWKRGRLFDQDCCRAYYEHMLDNRYSQIIEATKRPKSKWRPVALNTVEMEKLASRKLRIGAKTAMQIAERLYNQGYLSYPRTETNIFPNDMDLTNLVRAQAEDNRWGAFAARVLESGVRPRNGKSTDKAHPPIHPLKPGSGLAGDEARLYELVTRHFLACVSADAQGAETIVKLCVGRPSQDHGGGGGAGGRGSNATVSLMRPDEGEMFEAKGLIILQKNYLEVYVYERWVERDMPDFQVGDWLLPTNIEMVSGQTTAPPLLTEADLISLMDKHGIGTDATHADHIETIKQRLYVGLEQAKYLVPGQLGMGLVEGYDAMGFEMSKPHLRAELEADLRLICEGRKTKEEVLQHHLAKYKSLFQRAIAQAAQLDRALAVRLEQTAEDVSAFPGSLGEMSSTNSANTNANRVASCPACNRSIMIRQRRASNQHPLNNVSNNQSVPTNSFPDTPDPSRPAPWFLSCLGYPLCRFAVWFPPTILQVRVAQDISTQSPIPCMSCGGSASAHTPFQSGPLRANAPSAAGSNEGPLKLAFRLRQGTRLPNGYCQDEPNKEYVTCVFCDTDFLTVLGIRIAPGDSAPRSTRSPTRTSSPPTAPRRTPSNSPTASSTFAHTPSSYSNGTTRSFGSLATAAVEPSIHYSLPEPPGRPMPFTYPAAMAPSSSFAASEPDAVVCNCGIQAIVLTVKKAGPNQGRLFYRCAGGAGNSCDYFQWKTTDAAAPLAASTQIALGSQPFPNIRSFQPMSNSPFSPSSSAPTAGPPFGSTSGVGTSGSDGPVLCRCGEPAKLLRVNKANANQGREFYTCPNGRPGPSDAGGSNTGCNFFLWADSAGPPSADTHTGFGNVGNSSQWSGRRGRPAGGGGSSGSQGESGVSVGHVPMWPPPASTGLRGTTPSGSRRNPRSRTTTRKCGLCGEPGHTRTRCPRS